MRQESDIQPAVEDKDLGLRQGSLERVEPWTDQMEKFHEETEALPDLNLVDQMEKFHEETEALPDFNLAVSESTAPGFKKEERSEEVVIAGSVPPESTVQHYPLPHPPLPASRNEQAHLQESNAKYRDNHIAGRAEMNVSEPTAHYPQSAAYAPTGADIEKGASATCFEPPPETIAIFKEPPAMILIAGAFALLSKIPGNFRGPVERVLLGVMMVGFICSFMGLLTAGRRRMGRVSSLLQWIAVGAIFVTFFLVMTILITH